MRIISIDILRGIAILGILLMNITYHANIELGYVPLTIPPLSDEIISIFNTVFADGRFRTLFCILFGAGLAIQYEYRTAQGKNPKLFLKTRLHWLFVFGFLHGVFIFGGDILMLYSLCGLLVINNLNLEPDVLLRRSKKYLIIGSVISLIIAVVLMSFYDSSVLVLRGSDAYREQVNHWYGNYFYQILAQGMFAFGLLLVSFVFIFWEAAGLMYLGVYLYRSGFFKDGFSKNILIKICFAAIILSVLSLLPQLMSIPGEHEVNELIASIPAIFVALVYAHVIVKIANRKSKFLRLLASSGKLAFTLYILQSITMAILLRWLLPEFNSEATLADYFVIVGIYTIIQICLAHLYLRYFNQGPLEFLWRKLYLNSLSKKELQKEGSPVS